MFRIAFRINDECEENIFDLQHIQEEGNRAVYHYGKKVISKMLNLLYSDGFSHTY